MTVSSEARRSRLLLRKTSGGIFMAFCFLATLVGLSMQGALGGSIWMVGMTAVFAVPIGIGAAIYLEEYAPRHWITRVLQTNIANLAGGPSIVYGLLGLADFVRQMGLGRGLL